MTMGQGKKKRSETAHKEEMGSTGKIGIERGKQNVWDTEGSSYWFTPLGTQTVKAPEEEKKQRQKAEENKKGNFDDSEI